LTQQIKEDAADYPLEDWRYQVANNYTRLGYWDWVALQREMENNS